MESLRTISVRVTPETEAALKVYAVRRGLRVSTAHRVLLEEVLNRADITDSEHGGSPQLDEEFGKIRKDLSLIAEALLTTICALPEATPGNPPLTREQIEYWIRDRLLSR